MGHSYSTLGWIPEAIGSWVLPLRHERISSFETPAQDEGHPASMG
jgi:hypothetical protein